MAFSFLQQSFLWSDNDVSSKATAHDFYLFYHLFSARHPRA